ncbi:MAG: hypothetical protein WBW81_15705 [Methylocella sp.]
MTNVDTRLTIDRLGARGEGVAQGPDGSIFVSHALAGESIAAKVDGSRGAWPRFCSRALELTR